MANSNSASNNQNSSRHVKKDADKISDTLAELETRIRQLSAKLKDNKNLQSSNRVSSHAAGDNPVADSISDDSATLTAIANQLRAYESQTSVNTQSHAKDPVKTPVHTIETLTENLSEVQKLIQTLAREETVRRLSHRWDSFDEQLENLAGNQLEKLNHLEPSIVSIGQRLDDLSSTLKEFHRQLDIHQHPLTERFDNLTQLVAQLIELHLQSNAQKLEPVLHQLDERLAEIQQSVVNSVQTELSGARFDKIDQSLSELCTQVTAVIQNKDNQDLAQQIQQLNQRLDILNKTQNEPAKQFEKLLEPMNQLANLAARSNSEARDEDLALINQRFDDLLVRFDNYASRSGESAQHLETQEKETEPLISELKTEQIVAPLLSALTPRFDQFEKSLAQTRETVLETARHAAEQTIARMAENGDLADNKTVQLLAKDIKALETLSKRTETLNSETLDNVHHALVKIADRLTALEKAEKTKPVTAQTKQALESDIAHTNISIKAKQPLSAPVTENTAKEKQPVATVKIEAPAAAHNAPSPMSQQAQQSAAATMPDVNAILRRVRAEHPPHGKPNTNAQKDSASWPARRFKSSLDSADTGSSLVKDNEVAKQSSLNLVINRHRRSMMVGACLLAAAATTYFYAPEIEQQIAAFWPQEQAQQPYDVANIDTQTIVGSVNPTGDKDPVAELIVDIPSDITAVDTTDNFNKLQSNTQISALGGGINTTPSPLMLPISMPVEAVEQALPALTPIPLVPEEAGPAPLRDAAALGDADALFEIGNRYLDGRGVNSDHAKAAKWYKLAAERDQPLAQYRLGSLYEKGSGVERDLKAAQELYEKSAIKGNANSMHNLAVILASGANGPADNQSALNWFEKAAELGVLDSQYNLGILNAKGIGKATNLEESYKWFALAAKNGDEDAKEKLQEVESLLPADKLERAKATVELWKPKEPEASANYVNIAEEWDDQKPASLASVDMTKAIRNVQIMLHNNGYDAGIADGIMGEKTREAIVGFQKDNNLTPNGEIDESFVRTLLNKNG